MIVSEIKLYELLKAKIGEQEAEAFVEILESRVDKKFDEAKQYLATKEDVANTRAEIIKWMFIFWIGQIAATLAIMKFVH
jgi:hypothetical protein